MRLQTYRDESRSRYFDLICGGAPARLEHLNENVRFAHLVVDSPRYHEL